MNHVWQDVRFQGEQAMKSYAKCLIVFCFFFTAMMLPAVAQNVLHHPPPTINGGIEGATSITLDGSELEFRSKQSLFSRPIALRLANIGEKDTWRNLDESVTGSYLHDVVPSELNDTKVSDEAVMSGAINKHANFSENGLTIEPAPVREAREPTMLREEVFLYTRGVSGFLGGGEKARSDGPNRILK